MLVNSTRLGKLQFSTALDQEGHSHDGVVVPSRPWKGATTIQRLNAPSGRSAFSSLPAQTYLATWSSIP